VNVNEALGNQDQRTFIVAITLISLFLMWCTLKHEVSVVCPFGTGRSELFCLFNFGGMFPDTIKTRQHNSFFFFLLSPPFLGLKYGSRPVFTLRYFNQG
jgi:hypothetical protein